MYRQQQEDNSDHLQDIQDEKRKVQFRAQACQKIRKLNLKNQKCRQVLAQSYRRVDKMIDRVQRDNFNFNEDVDLLNDVLTSSYFYKPFPIEEKDMLFRTRSSFEYFKANRRWKPPAIQIQNELISPNQGTVKLDPTKTQFTIKIESQPGSRIMYSNMPSHPLMTKLQQEPKNENPKYFRYYQGNEVQTMLNPPIKLNIVVVGDQVKIPSKLLRLRIQSQRNNIGNQIGHGNAERGFMQFPFDESYQSNSFTSMQVVRENEDRQNQE